MTKKNYNINNYDCRKSYQKIIDSVAYLEEIEKANNCFSTQQIIEEKQDYENAFIIGYRGIQILGNSALIKRKNIKSKEKNCQFKFLYQENLIDENILDKLSLLSIKRNNIYYNNQGNNEIDKNTYYELVEIIKLIKKELFKLIEK